MLYNRKGMYIIGFKIVNYFTFQGEIPAFSSTTRFLLNVALCFLCIHLFSQHLA